MTTAGLRRPAPGSVPSPAARTRRDRAAAGAAVPGQPRVPMAMALLAGFGALLWAALHWHRKRRQPSDRRRSGADTVLGPRESGRKPGPGKLSGDDLQGAQASTVRPEI
jgi:hypothetical protein